MEVGGGLTSTVVITHKRITSALAYYSQVQLRLTGKYRFISRETVRKEASSGAFTVTVTPQSSVSGRGDFSEATSSCHGPGMSARLSCGVLQPNCCINKVF